MMPQTIFSGQDYIDFALVDSLLHFNDGKKGHAGIFSQIGLDVVSILTFIIGQTTPTRYVPALKRTRKSKKKRLDNLKGYKEGTRRTITNWGNGLSIVLGMGLTNFNKFTKLLFTSLLTFIYKMT